MEAKKKGKKIYKKPAITRELELETRAGTPLGPIPGPLDLPGSDTKANGS